MNAVCLTLIALLAGADNGEPQIDLVTEQQAVVEGVLENNATLLALHRGYLAWLEKHPDVASAEEAFVSLMQTRGFSVPANRFDEALVEAPGLEARRDDYYRFLVENRDARLAVDDLHRFELAHRTDRETWGRVLAYLRANGDEALTFLENPRWVKPLPEALMPLVDAARRDDPSVERLQSDFQALHDIAEAHLRLFPWWETLYAAGSPLEHAFAGLEAHFRQYPHRFWVWHRRELVLAKEREAQKWIAYWHRMVRRTAGLNTAYYAYLDALNRRPELGEAAETRWREGHGEPPSWPPENSPPTLTPLFQPDEDTPSVERPERIEIERPARPEMPSRDGVKRPIPPTRPVRPERPVKEDGESEDVAAP